MSELIDLVAHLFDSISELYTLVRDRFSNNIAESFTSMTAKEWIRLVIIVGAYALLRPYIIKLGAKHQEKQLEKQFAEEEAKQAEISPNQLRGEVGIPEDSDDDEEQAETTASDWGKKARKRQRNMIKKLLDAEEKRLQELQEDEEDKDIEQYLVADD
ncbi:DUF1531-domain-containing protein [Daldinia loculata]|uniref:DUF1531-domain-containing protein n=1 Tax=Daldinia loculata TaxID=103429 RepID=UPI0020C1DEC7|nr:DUF1531-domain-containing protein [Daldinia loculata]KAI1651675.1 DUF1531-domain-containing protein [Daldinia loculata]KAI2778674.1 DUF1531-domain-containing protein [Daldinia loculata]